MLSFNPGSGSVFVLVLFGFFGNFLATLLHVFAHSIYRIACTDAQYKRTSQYESEYAEKVLLHHDLHGTLVRALMCSALAKRRNWRC